MIEFHLLRVIEIETSSYCNRRCVSCIRNSHPDREKLQSWFERNLMPEEDILEIIRQVVDMGFDGSVCLSHFNEPLFDTRLPSIIKKIKEIKNLYVFFHSNGDLLTKEVADTYEGVIDGIAFTLYGPSELTYPRQKLIASCFHKTSLKFVPSGHVASHFSPIFPIEDFIKDNIDNHCIEPQVRMIFNHKGQMLLCCEDVIGNFDLGSFPDKSVKELWYNAQEKINILKECGGRNSLPYCTTCPKRGN